MKLNIGSDKIIIIIFMIIMTLLFLYNGHSTNNSKKTINMVEDEYMKIFKEEMNNLPEDYKKYIIYNKPKILEDRYNEISKTIYSMQYLYILHTELFEHIIDNVNYFITIYEDIIENTQLKKYNYVGYEIELLVNVKNLINNAIDQFTFTVSYDEMDQIKQHKKDMDNVLKQYTDRITKQYNIFLENNGYDIETKIIMNEDHPVPLDSLKTIC